MKPQKPDIPVRRSSPVDDTVTLPLSAISAGEPSTYASRAFISGELQNATTLHWCC